MKAHTKYFQFHYRFQIDHFGFGNYSTFKQRYLVNDTFWQAAKDERNAGPIFFYTGRHNIFMAQI